MYIAVVQLSFVQSQNKGFHRGAWDMFCTFWVCLVSYKGILMNLPEKNHGPSNAVCTEIFTWQSLNNSTWMLCGSVPGKCMVSVHCLIGTIHIDPPCAGILGCIRVQVPYCTDKWGSSFPGLIFSACRSLYYMVTGFFDLNDIFNISRILEYQKKNCYAQLKFWTLVMLYYSFICCMNGLEYTHYCIDRHDKKLCLLSSLDHQCSHENVEALVAPWFRLGGGGYLESRF